MNREVVPGDARSNPFATRYIRPSAAKYLFPTGVSPKDLIRQLQSAGWRGQIVGPHGSGKSTLLQALLPEVVAAGKAVVIWRITSTHRLGPLSVLRDPLPSNSVLIIDGYEQLGLLSRAILATRLLLARTARVGLLVTTHAPVRSLPLLMRTEPTLELAQRVVAELAPPGDRVIDSRDISQAFQNARGDIREMLLALYDVYRNRTLP